MNIVVLPISLKTCIKDSAQIYMHQIK